jgi:hypothetical protein
MQAGLGVEGRPVLRDGATNAGQEMDGNRIGRCATLRDGGRIFRFLASEGDRTRARTPRAVYLVPPGERRPAARHHAAVGIPASTEGPQGNVKIMAPRTLASGKTTTEPSADFKT